MHQQTLKLTVLCGQVLVFTALAGVPTRACYLGIGTGRWGLKRACLCHACAWRQ